MVIIEMAVPTDADAICSVLRRSIIELCGPDYNHIDGFVDAWLRNKTPDNVKAWIVSERSCFVVARALENSRIVGVGAISRAGDVLLCYVIPEYLGTGAGRDILIEFEGLAQMWGLRKLTTFSTVTARAFYVRQGFQTDGAPVLQDGQIIEIPMVKWFDD